MRHPSGGCQESETTTGRLAGGELEGNGGLLFSVGERFKRCYLGPVLHRPWRLGDLREIMSVRTSYASWFDSSVLKLHFTKATWALGLNAWKLSNHASDSSLHTS